MSWWPWLALALLVFWAVGAYNRLVRLRAQVRNCFQDVDRCGQRLLQLARSPLPAGEGERGAAERAGLRGAAVQWEAALNVARLDTLSAAAIATLQAAHTTLQVWQARLAELSPADPAADDWTGRWADASRQAGEAAAQFNRAVQAHNEAIRQFPAVLLAIVFGFRPAGTL